MSIKTAFTLRFPLQRLLSFSNLLLFVKRYPAFLGFKLLIFSRQKRREKKKNIKLYKSYNLARKKQFICNCVSVVVHGQWSHHGASWFALGLMFNLLLTAGPFFSLNVFAGSNCSKDQKQRFNGCFYFDESPLTYNLLIWGI